MQNVARELQDARNCFIRLYNRCADVTAVPLLLEDCVASFYCNLKRMMTFTKFIVTPVASFTNAELQQRCINLLSL
jgi:hypothetical protein